MYENINKIFNEIDFSKSNNSDNNKNIHGSPSNGNNSSFLDNFIEGKIESNKLQIKDLDVNNLESIRLSLSFRNKDSNSKILLEQMKKNISPIHNPKKRLEDKDYKIKIINAINTNKGLDTSNSNINIENDEEEPLQINISENTNDDSEKFNIKNSNEENSIIRKKEENNRILEKQNNFILELLDNNNDNIKKDRKIIISNLYFDLNNLKENKKTLKKIGLKLDKINTNENGKDIKKKHINNKKINIPINKIMKTCHSIRNIKVKQNESKNKALNKIINYKLKSQKSKKNINNKINIVNNYYQTNIYKSNKENINMNNRNLNKNKSFNKKNDILKVTSLIKRNKSFKRIFLGPSNSCRNTVIPPIKNINYYKVKKEKSYINNENNKRKRINIPINNKKLNLTNINHIAYKKINRNTSNNCSKNKCNKKIIKSHNNILQIIKEYNNILINNKSLTKNNSFNFLFNK